MVFSTSIFLFGFLPAFLLCYALLPWKNAVALLFSLLFFAWGEGSFLVLLLAVIAVNFVVGGALERPEQSDKNARKVVLVLGVAANLGTLIYYKYIAFFIGDLLQMPLSDGFAPHLPLGISFFIFQSISYLVDVYRREARAARSFFDLALYISMFPQLIAGPIVRYGAVAIDLRGREISTSDVLQGMRWFVTGLAYKVLLANNSASVADAVFAAPAAQLTVAVAWLGVLAYTLQIFFDFAGYSLMAMGLGRIMGFHFPRNFNYPYISRSITEFWRRWHMSLSSWFRDYLYIPLGGNRQGDLKTYRNLLVVFFLCGLWHGAAWTFVVWGLFHGALLVLERWGLSGLLQRMPSALSFAYCLLMVMIGWVFFRADTLSDAMRMLGAMSGRSSAVDAAGFNAYLSNEKIALLGVALLMCAPWLERGRWRTWHKDEHAEGEDSSSVWGVASDVALCTLLFGVCSVYVLAGTYNPFIYFRF